MVLILRLIVSTDMISPWLTSVYPESGLFRSSRGSITLSRSRSLDHLCRSPAWINEVDHPGAGPFRALRVCLPSSTPMRGILDEAIGPAVAEREGHRPADRNQAPKHGNPR